MSPTGTASGPARPGWTLRRLLSARNVVVAAATALALLLPLFGSNFFVEFVMTRTMILGIAAATIVFLAAYGGMISLAQYLLAGVAGFMVGNAVVAQDAWSKGLKLGWNPWVAVLFALAVTTFVAFVLGALASRTTGIYFLMITLTYAVIGYYVFGSITPLSGFGGITGIDPPGLFEDHPVRMYLALVVLSMLVYVAFRVLAATPFGLALQGIRDDPVRMASLGFNVSLHRTLAFTLAGFTAGLAGVFNVWWNGQIDPTSISIGPTLDLLIVAVIGGTLSLEGAWLGAFVFVAANNYLRNLPLVDHIGITEARFNTIVGVLVLLIMILSPDGLAGIIDRVRKGLRRLILQPPGSGAGSAEAATGSSP